jgi:hypothetical protein
MEKRNPPEPDILCSIDGVGEVAFEVVELIDESLARRTWDQLKLISKFKAGCDALQTEQIAAVRSRVGNALIHVTFEDSARFNTQVGAIDSVFEALSAVDSTFEGELRRQMAPELSSAVRSIRINRIRSEGPFFDVDAGGSLSDPTVGSIRSKWAKVYTTPHPMELLAYYELQPELPDILWRPTLESFLSGNWSSSRFRRVWVYDCVTQAVRFSLTKPGQ